VSVLLLVLICGAYDCHYEGVRMFDTYEECWKAIGYDVPPRKGPQFKCVPLSQG
jgi:hypothetical protein